MRTVILLLAVLVSAEAALAKPPNVLFVLVDDLRPELGTYGVEHARTPHIDALAAEGVVFERVYAAVPVCGASRAAMLSGRRPTTSRFLSYDSRLDQDLPNAPSMPDWFKRHGYRTVAYGKIFDVVADSADGWSEPVWNPEPRWFSHIEPDGRGSHLQKAYVEAYDTEVGPPVERAQGQNATYPDEHLATRAIEDLPRLAKDQQPFFVALGFRKPHLPFTAPEAWWAPFDAVAALSKVPPSAPLIDVPRVALHNSPELRRQYSGIPAQGRLPVELQSQLLRGYAASVSYVDTQVGRVLAALQEQGLADNTIVVLTGDHGWNLGEHGLWTKHSLFDVTLRVPLIIRVPGGQVLRSNSVSELIDLFPTLVDLAGLPVPAGLEGESLVPLLNGEELASEQIAISRWFHGESVRTDQHRYTEWHDETGIRVARMLFDVLEDPDETVNLAERLEVAAETQRLSEVLSDQGTRGAWSPMLRAIVERFSQL